MKQLLLTLNGMVQGFPDTQRKLYNVTKAWAKIVTFQPYHVTFDPQVEPYLTEEEKNECRWKEGVIPAEWLIAKIRDSFEWMPAPVVAREIYCKAGFKPADGVDVSELLALLPATARRRPPSAEGE